MPVDKGLRTAGRGRPVPEFTGVVNRLAGRQLQGNMGSSDVRGRLLTRVITLHLYDGTDSFKIRVRFANPNRASLTSKDEVANHDSYTDTVAFVRGTNGTAAAIQTALITATGDAGLTVSGTTDEGPFTVTPSGAHRDQYELQLVTLSACSGNVTSTKVVYPSSLGLPGEAHRHGTDTGIPASTGPGRQAGLEVPLGQSTVTDGTGQTAQTTLAQPTVDSMVGGDDQVAILTTEVASGGSAGIAGFAIFHTADDSPHSVVYTEDADGDVTITGLDSATDYYVVAFTQAETGSDAAAKSRISVASAPEFFTTT